MEYLFILPPDVLVYHVDTALRCFQLSVLDESLKCYVQNSSTFQELAL